MELSLHSLLRLNDLDRTSAVFDAGFSISDYAASKKGLTMNNEPEMAWKANLR